MTATLRRILALCIACQRRPRRTGCDTCGWCAEAKP